MVTAEEANLIRQIQQLGIERSKDIFNLLAFLEGGQVEEQAPKSRLTKKRTAQLVLLGETMMEACPQGQRGRRKGQIDPKSKRQQVWAACRSILADGPLHRSELLLKLEEVTGLTYAQVQSNADAFPEVERYLGRWTLKAGSKAA